MTGRRLYDIHCDSYKECRERVWKDGRYVDPTPLIAWPFLKLDQRKQWNATAKRMAGVKR